MTLTDPTFTNPDQIDLTNCEREPIHIPGSIQPHGLLLVLSVPTWTMLQVSANSEALIGVKPEMLLDRSFLHLFPVEQRDEWHQLLQSTDVHYSTPLQVPFQVNEQVLIFDGLIHRQNELLLLELENSTPFVTPTANDGTALRPQTHDHFLLVRRAIAQLQNIATLSEAVELLARTVRQFTNFDRVMVYQFHADGHGEVTAEALAAGQEAFLGLHYPASDIPAQARQLYCLNWLRLIVDVAYRPVPLMPQLNPTTNAPLDLSHSVLRSVSPIHLQYLHNMGVGASMSISLLKDGELWGLIVCHHRTAKFVPFHIRTACEALGTVMSVQLTAKQFSASVVNLSERLAIQRRLLDAMSQNGLVDGLTETTDLLDLVQATGAAVIVGGTVYNIGSTPTEAETLTLLRWLRRQFQQQGGHSVFQTHQLSALFAAAEPYSAVASGLLALEISAYEKDYLLFFRPELIQTVNWSGDPNKPVEIGADGTAQLSPRRSFALWRETVYQTALAWSPTDIEQAQDLHRAIGRYIISRAEELTTLNRELTERNNDLDSFAYVAAHDLKEPLHGIYSHAFYLEEQKGDLFDEAAKERLTALMRLTKRMDELLDALLQYSRMGRIELAHEALDLNQVLADALDMLSASITAVEIRVPRRLPSVQGDPILLREVFANLISNAIKYNDKPTRWVEIGYLSSVAGKSKVGEATLSANQSELNRIEDTDPASAYTVVYYVSDNGIGIRERHYNRIFDIFRRLHGRTEFGGGSGAGLAIVKKIIERHAGRIWVESVYKEGTTFYFTLGQR